MNPKIKDLASAAWGFFVFALFVTAEIVGITRGFHKSAGHGVATIFIPPYAWYNAVAVLWEPPAWKEDWDLKTRRLAMVIIASPSEKLENQIELANQMELLHKWVKAIPAKEREKLRTEMERFNKEWIAYVDVVCSAVLLGKEVPVYAERLELRAVPSFEKVFVEATKQSATDMRTMLKLQSVKDLPQEEMKNNLAAYQEISSHEIMRRTEEVFSDK